MQRDMSGETICDRLESRRVAAAFIQRMIAIWTDDRAVIEARHANSGHDTAVAVGPCVPFSEALIQRHGRLGAAVDGDTEIAFGPSIEIPLNPR